MANSGIPSWEEWDEQLNEDQRKYSLYKILYSLDKRLGAVESKRWKNGLLTIGGAFLGGAAVMGMALLGKLIL